MIDAAELKQTMLLAMSEHHSGNAEEAGRIVDAQLAALEAAGVRMVPVQATEEMVETYYEEMPSAYDVDMRDAGEARRAIAELLAASPYAQKDTTHESD